MNTHKNLEIRTSPHIRGRTTTKQIMRHVVIALLPVVLWAIYLFGLSAFFLIVTSTIACLMTEAIYCKIRQERPTINDWSAAVTGILLGLTLPPGFPLWMAFLGGVVAIGIGKVLFGGLGFNMFNPALVGRAFLQAAFPVAITTWESARDPSRFTNLFSSSLTLPFLSPVYEAVTGATPLAAWKFDHQLTQIEGLLIGTTKGSTGETGALLILAAGLYLAVRKMLNWHIPAAIFLSMALLSSLFYTIDARLYPAPLFMLFSGGLMLGAMFMATDMVCSPLTKTGVWLYGALIGILTFVIRVWGGLPEGVMYAILLANASTPLIERFTQPKIFGSDSK